MAFQKNVYSSLVGWGAYRCLLGLICVLFKSFMSLLVICLVILYIIESRVLKPTTNFIELSATLNSMSFCFMQFGAL